MWGQGRARAPETTGAAKLVTVVVSSLYATLAGRVRVRHETSHGAGRADAVVRPVRRGVPVPGQWSALTRIGCDALCLWIGCGDCKGVAAQFWHPIWPCGFALGARPAVVARSTHIDGPETLRTISLSEGTPCLRKSVDQDSPLNPSLPSTGRPNQTAGSSPGPVPPELSPTPTDNPNPAVHPGINTRGPSTNLPCPTRHAQKRRNPSMMPTNPTHELICPGGLETARDNRTLNRVDCRS